MNNENKLAQELMAFVRETVDYFQRDQDWMTRQLRAGEIITDLADNIIPRLGKTQGPRIWKAVKYTVVIMSHIIKEARKEIR